jgi:hypothetical protein
MNVQMSLKWSTVNTVYSRTLLLENPDSCKDKIQSCLRVVQIIEILEADLFSIAEMQKEEQ